MCTFFVCLYLVLFLNYQSKIQIKLICVKRSAIILNFTTTTHIKQTIHVQFQYLHLAIFFLLRDRIWVLLRYHSHAEQNSLWKPLYQARPELKPPNGQNQSPAFPTSRQQLLLVKFLKLNEKIFTLQSILVLFACEISYGL